jgi:penicillin G amidase
MRIVKFISSLLLCGLLIYALDTHNPLGQPVPALGKVLNPVSGFWANAEPKMVKSSKKLSLKGFKGKAEVIFDERLVPHIFAQTPEDAAYAHGYVTAAHRLFQMDLSTRKVSGRLSEILGERTLEIDLLQRRKGLNRIAQMHLETIEKSPSENMILQAYVDGVNAYMATLKPATYPVEFKLLGMKPEPWSKLKSILFLKAMAEDLCFRHEDIAATNTRTWLGAEDFDFLFPEYNPKQSPIIPADTKWDFKPVVNTAKIEPSLLSGIFPEPALPMAPEANGSNNWAVSPAKTLNGNPILCNDPHLALRLPSIWYEVQICTPEANAYGVSLPGLPGVVIGFNEHIAWGMTNLGHDLLDWYQIKFIDKDRTRYELDGQVKTVEKVKETIQVRGRKKPVDIEVKYTKWGPMVWEDSTKSDYYGLAMHWIVADPAEKRPFHEFGALWGLMKAKNYAEYVATLNGYDAPPQNFVFASKDGDIALRVNGRLPIRSKGQGRFVQDGSSSANSWQGYIPRDQIPATLNPARGFVSSANQHSTTPDYPYYYYGGFDDYRGRFINRSLEAMDSVTVKDMMALQQSSYSLQAEDAMPLILKLMPREKLSKAEADMFDELKTWDFRYHKDQAAPAIFQGLLDSIYRLSLDEFNAQSELHEVIYPEGWRFFELLDQHASHKMFDIQGTKNLETAADIVLLAMKKVYKANAAAWKAKTLKWQTTNNASVNHMALIPAFSHNNLPISGYNQAPNAIRGGHGPSWRMVVELDKKKGLKAYGVYPGGQSGNPGSHWYDSMVLPWAKGEYNELFVMKNAQDKGQKTIAKWEFAAGD